MKNKRFKFRVWDKHNEQWLFGENSNQHYLNFHCYDNGDFHPHGISPETLEIQQFTGLIDTNQKPIYEGDIVKVDPNHEVHVLRSDKLPQYTKGEIKWLCQAFKVCQERLGATYLGDFASCDCCSCGLEVIGNVCENSKLEILLSQKLKIMNEKKRKIDILLKSGSVIKLVCDSFQIVYSKSTGEVESWKSTGVIGSNLLYLNPSEIVAVLDE